MRASEDEREGTIASLRDAVTSSRLTLEEFGERVGAALVAKTRGDLTELVADLPAPVVTLHPRRRRTRVTAAFIAHVVRRGRLRLGRRSTVLSVLADVDYDLRDAVVEVGQSAVTVLAMLGNVDVYVPEGIDVQVSGLSLLGHRRDWGRDVAAGEGPSVHVRVLGFGGTVDVWRVPPGVAGDYSGVIRHLKAESRGGELPRGPSTNTGGHLAAGEGPLELSADE